MANITGTAGNDTITPGGVSAGVAGGTPGAGADSIQGLDGNDTLEGGAGANTLRGGAGNDFLVNGSDGEVIDGGDGTDVALWENATGSVTINLAAGTANGAGVGSDTLVGIENAHGSRDFGDSITGSALGQYFFGRGGNDTILALDGNDWFYGGSGADLLDGGNGFDRAAYNDDGFDPAGPITRGIVANLSAASVVVGAETVAAGTAVDGWGSTDTLASVEAVTGTDFGDVIVGGVASEFLDGGAGNDSLTGGAGQDTLRGGAGDDVLVTGGGFAISFSFGNDGADELRGRVSAAGGFNLYLDGGAGNDTVRGFGQVENFADYSARTGPITAILGNSGSVSLAGGEVDTLDTVRGIRGTVQADSITGSGASERFMLGMGGADIVDAGSGNDQATYIDFVPAGGGTTGVGIQANLATGSATVAGAVQTLTGFENLAGSDFDDVLTGSDSDNEFRPVAGKDTIDGQGGYDTVRYSSTGFVFNTVPQAGVTINLEDGTGTDNWGFADTFTNIEAVHGSFLNDDLTGRAMADLNSNVRGLGGNDMLRAPGLDTRVVADYREDPNGIRVNLSDADATLNGVLVLARTGGDGFGFTDSYDSIQGVLGSNSGDIIQGGARADRLYGWAGNDTIIAGDGDDTIGGGQGIDIFDGGAGYDLLSFERYSASEAMPTLGVEASLLTGLIANDGWGSAESILGGSTNTVEMLIGWNFNDDLTGKVITELAPSGTRQQSYLRGNQGADTIRGVAGEGRWISADHRRDADANADGFGVTVNLVTQTAIDGWGNTDTLFDIGSARGSDFADSLIGDDGDNWFRGQAGADVIIGGLGTDYLSHGDSTGSVILDLQAGTVTDDGWGSADSATGFEQAGGGSGDDTLLGSTADNLLQGFAGDDSLSGRNGNDTLRGFGDDDTLDGGKGTDSLAGGTGNDLIIVDNAADTVSELAGEGTDTVQSAVNWTLGDNLEALVLTGKAKTGAGNSLDNAIIGTAGKNTLTGNAGNDTLDGGDGADLLDGGAGADSLIGGSGNDTYLLDDPADIIVELALGGTDEVRVTFDYVLGAELENLTLGGAALNGTGNGLNNVIRGNGNANLLSGLGGKDELIGGGGADTLLGGDGADTLEGGGGADSLDGGAQGDLFRWMQPNQGNDTVAGFNPAQDDLAFAAAGFGGGLVAGVALTAAQFETNATGAASTADVRFIYNTATGVLTHDVNGNGAGGASVIATFLGLPALSIADFVIIA
ncbi:MAG: hypothetical protein K2X49_00655 [Acetobacteraceae bacterium]|nr:hypothetical protein [Acetobacteraceae bacterium]